MKKLLLTLAIAAPLAFASFSYADDDPDAGKITDAKFSQAGGQIVGLTGAADDVKTPIGKLSSGVALAANTADTGYALITVHKNGTKAFGTGHDSTAIYTANIAKGSIGKLEDGDVKAPAKAAAEGSFYATSDDGKQTAESTAEPFDGTDWKAM